MQSTASFFYRKENAKCQFIKLKLQKRFKDKLKLKHLQKKKQSKKTKEQYQNQEIVLNENDYVDIEYSYIEKVKNRMNKFVWRKNKMRKSDFIANTERWLVRNDIKDDYFMLSDRQIKQTDVNRYIASVKSMLERKAPDLIPEFKQSIKDSKVRGINISR